MTLEKDYALSDNEKYYGLSTSKKIMAWVSSKQGIWFEDHWKGL